MRKILYTAPLLLALASCTEYSKVLKSRDAEYKFEYAKKPTTKRSTPRLTPF